MSLVENLARRHHSPLELMREIERTPDTWLLNHRDRSKNRLQRRVHERDLLPARPWRGAAAGRHRAWRHPDERRNGDRSCEGWRTSRRLSLRRMRRRRFRAIRFSPFAGSSNCAASWAKGWSHGTSVAKAEETGDRGFVGASLPQGDGATKATRSRERQVSQSRLLFVVNALRRLFADEHFVTLLARGGLTDVAPSACRADRHLKRLTWPSH